MRVPSQVQRGGRVGFNMTPMIDVVFLLIIFFLVSSHLAKQEAQMELPLPDAVTGQEPTDTAAARVTVNVRDNGQILLAGRVVPAVELQDRLTRRRQAGGRDLEVRIRGDRSVGYGAVEPILLACIRAGIWNVTFAVLEQREVR